MKKTYINPQTLVIKVTPTSIINTSPTSVQMNWDSENGGSVQMTKEDNSWDVWGDDDFRDE
ncbi:MAG: hypothetical protein J5671_07485 [Bacteroidaceae bacterium]|nr:hypothetical protein [Bacteroidaceae bacterium]